MFRHVFPPTLPDPAGFFLPHDQVAAVVNTDLRGLPHQEYLVNIPQQWILLVQTPVTAGDITSQQGTAPTDDIASQQETAEIGLHPARVSRYTSTDSFTDSKDDSSGQVAELTQRSNRTVAEINRLSEELREALLQVEGVTKERDEIQLELLKLREATNRATAETNRLSEELREALLQVEGVTRERNAAQSQNLNLQEEITDYQRLHGDLSSVFHHLSQRFDRINYRSAEAP